MTIFLHIGMGKTGTTSIQTFLEINAAALATCGIITPTTLARRNHRRLTMYALDDGVVDNLRRAKRMTTPESVRVFRERLAASFSAEAATWRSSQTIVMTSEQMTRLRSVEEVSRLKSLIGLAGHEDIRVILYVRRQDLAHISIYSQWIKGGLDVPFRPEIQGAHKSTLYYDRFIAPWAQVFGSGALIVRPFEPSSLKNADAVDDFMSVLGVDDLSGFVRPPRANTSLDVHTIEFLRRLNSHIPRWVNNKQERSREALVAALEAISVGPKLRMSRATAEGFMAPFVEGNAAVARDYLARDVLFQEGLEDLPGTEPSLTPEAALAIANALFRQTIIPVFGVDDVTAATAMMWNKTFD